MKSSSSTDIDHHHHHQVDKEGDGDGDGDGGKEDDGKGSREDNAGGRQPKGTAFFRRGSPIHTFGHVEDADGDGDEGKEDDGKQEREGVAFFRWGSRMHAFGRGSGRAVVDSMHNHGNAENCGGVGFQRSRYRGRAASSSSTGRILRGWNTHTWRRGRGSNNQHELEGHESVQSSWPQGIHRGSDNHAWRQANIGDGFEVRHRGGSSGSSGLDNNNIGWQRGNGRGRQSRGPSSVSRGALCRGIVVKVLSDHAFLRPQTQHTTTIPLASPSPSASINDDDVSFLLQGKGTLTGLMEPRPGDVFEYISNGWNHNPRATFARLISCIPRSSSALSHYLHALFSKSQQGPMPHHGTLQTSSLPIMHQKEEEEDPRSLFRRRFQGGPRVEERILPSSSLPNIHQQEENTVGGGEGDIVLREITKCPAGILLALEQPQPTLDIVIEILELNIALSNYSTRLYMAQLAKFYKLFHGSQFLVSPHALQKYIAMPAADHAQDDYGDRNNFKTRLVYPFLLSLAKSSPSILPSVMPLAHIATACQTNGDLKFLLDLFKIVSYDKGAPSNLYWDKTPLIPLRSELLQNATNPGQLNQFAGLSPVIKSGSYGSAENYVDTYFRLLREDCHASLKIGICDLQSGKLEQGMKVWLNVSVMGVHFGQTTPGLTVALRCEIKGSRKLPKPGSLLCVYCDGGKLQCPIWAIVRRSGVTLSAMNTAVFFVEVIDMKETESGAYSRRKSSTFSTFVQLITSCQGMIVLESPAYFQAYEPVLRSLQTLNPQMIPFQEEIVHAQWPSLAPYYLTKSTSLDWNCMFEKRNNSLMRNKSFYFSHIEEMRAGVYEFDKLQQKGFQTILNDNQKEALDHVLKSRLAMIQGPPGTGKTFLGSKILQLILSADALPKSPVLVISYKNKALDELLEKCMEFCGSPGSVIRVGGRSSSKELEEANLQNFLSESMHIFRSDWVQNTKNLKEIQKNMYAAMQNVEACFSVKIYSSHSWLASAPEQFIYKLLSRRFVDRVFLTQIPEGTSLSQVLFEKNPENSDLCEQLGKVMSKNLKQWLPDIWVFREVCQCLSSLKGFVELSEVNFPTNCESESGDSDLDDDDDDEFCSETMYKYNGIHKSKRFKNYDIIDDWLISDFRTITVQKNDMIFFGFGLEELDSLEENVLFQIDPWKLSDEQRCIAVQTILKRNLEDVTRKLHDLQEEYKEICNLNEEQCKRRKLDVLRDAKIIGMTTTGAAMHQDILRALSPSVILVEEAAEILEPQIMALLNPGLQQLILIGDHYQLRPAVQCYELDKEYELGVSMFERLAEHNKLPFQVLNLQSRMRDEFLPLLRPIYPALQSNLECVSGIRNQVPKCMMSSMFFWTHSFEEKKQQSVQNDEEANMVIALTLWLVKEDNAAENITVIAAYSEQVSLIRQKMKIHQELNKVGVFTIDQFQGSENQIVIVSLVRSNEECNIGHLNIRNRLCVAVSRARGGLYICGNQKTLSSSPHWRQLIEHFHDQEECLGDSIFLQCPRHISSSPLLLSSQHISSFSTDMCPETCNAKLPDCDHLCVGKCHVGRHLKCKVKVEYVFQDCGHSTTRTCSQEPNELLCNENISVKIKRCGHTIICQCWKSKSQATLKCDVPCTETLHCGHPCLLSCSETCNSNPCETCETEKKIKALKDKELARQEIKEKLQEIDVKLKQLESEDAVPVLRNDVGMCDSMWEYNMVKDRFEKYIQADHQFYPLITRIEEVCNPNLRKKFLEAHQEMIDPTKATQMLFHGTSSEAIENIIRDGFRLPGKEKNNMYGRGIYFATDSSKSAQPLYTKGSKKLLLCEVLVGNALCLNKPDPDLNLEKIRRKFHDSVYSERNSKAMGGTLFDEFVVYDPRQAYPNYIISFEQLDIHSPDFQRLNLRHHNQHTDFVRTSLKPSSDLLSNMADEFHFRMAESQFLRMQSDRKMKVVEVEVIYNRELEGQYEKEKEVLKGEGKDVRERLVFHGTTKEAIEKIVKEGFKVGGEGVEIRTGVVHGRGVYTATKPETSLHYAGNTNMMLLSKAVLAKEGDDYKSVGGDVYVIKNVHQLLPHYIVHYAPVTQ